MLRIIVCIFTVTIISLQCVLSQDEQSNDVICTKCVCDQGNVNCTGLDLRISFTEEEWTNTTIQPINVDLSNNPLTSFPRLPALPIQVLNLSRCDLEELENEFLINLESLTDLDLSYNKLTTTSISKRVFMGPRSTDPPPKKFENMRTLNLSNNYIYSLQQDVFIFMNKVTTLDLSGNPLTYIDQVTMAALADLTLLKVLKLSNCKLEVLPPGLLRRQRQLEYIDLSNNKFTVIPEVLAEAPSLVYLNLDRNPIESIEETSTMSALTNLQEFSLRRMSKLKAIGPGALGLESLKVLHLSFNPQLTDLDAKFLVWEDEDGIERWPVLEELNLNNNNLSHINSHILDRWDLLTRMDVSGNPYVCDCNAQWMVEVLTTLGQTAINGTAGNVICKSPPELRGLTFEYLKDSGKSLVCPEINSSITSAEADGIVMIGVMIGVFVTFPLVLVTVVMWKRGYFSRCRRRFHSKKARFDDHDDDLY